MLRFRSHTDAQIVQRVLGGHHDDFEVLVRRYMPAVHALGCAHMNSAVDADDVVQEAFIKAWLSLNGLKEPAKFGAWLFTIARNTCANLKRGRARRAERERLLADLAPKPASSVEREELRTVLRHQIEKMDEQAREVLLLHYFAGKRVRELATLLEISPSAVKKRLQRAREALGRTMLLELTPREETKADLKKRSKALMALVVGTPAPWHGATVAATAASAGGVAVMAKVVAALCATAIVAGGAATLARKGGFSIPRLDSATTISSSAGGADQAGSRAGGAAPASSANPSADSSAGDPAEEESPTVSVAAASSQEDQWAEGSVECSVAYPDGRPAANATVEVFPRSHFNEEQPFSGELIASGTTNGSGRLTITGLQERPYAARCAVRDRIALADFQTERYQTHKRISLTLERVGRIAGTVTNQGGQPIAGARLTPGITGTGDQARHWHWCLWATTDEGGAFALDNLPLGSRTLQVAAEGYASLKTEPISVGDRSAHLVMTKGGQISGTIVDANTGRPIADVKLNAGDRSAVSEADG